MEIVSNSSKLREMYNFRWWTIDLNDTYFVVFNRSDDMQPAGKQITFCYGSKGNHELLECYGFCMDWEENPFATYKLRVPRGVSSETSVDDEEDFLLSQKILDDYDNMDKRTDVMNLQADHLCPIFMEYLRSSLLANYKEQDGVDQDYLMISCPRVIPYELMVIDWAIKIMEKHGEVLLLKKSSLDQDLESLDKLVCLTPEDW